MNTTDKRRTSDSMPSHEPTPGLYGWITHTELASTDPDATKAWCESMFGWTFQPEMALPGVGSYHLFAYSSSGGGGIRATAPDEPPGSTFSVHVEDAQEAFDRALAAGASEELPPTRVMPGVTIAAVRAPGGVRIGFSGP